MWIYQVEKLTKYIVNKILSDNFSNGKLNKNDDISKLKEKLTTEVEARLCVIPEGKTFDDLVSAMEDQVNINKYINQLLPI